MTTTSNYRKISTYGDATRVPFWLIVKVGRSGYLPRLVVDGMAKPQINGPMFDNLEAAAEYASKIGGDIKILPECWVA